MKVALRRRNQTTRLRVLPDNDMISRFTPYSLNRLIKTATAFNRLSDFYVGEDICLNHSSYLSYLAVATARCWLPTTRYRVYKSLHLGVNYTFTKDIWCYATVNYKNMGIISWVTLSDSFETYVDHSTRLLPLVFRFHIPWYYSSNLSNNLYWALFIALS